MSAAAPAREALLERTFALFARHLFLWWRLTGTALPVGVVFYALGLLLVWFPPSGGSPVMASR